MGSFGFGQNGVSFLPVFLQGRALEHRVLETGPLDRAEVAAIAAMDVLFDDVQLSFVPAGTLLDVFQQKQSVVT